MGVFEEDREETQLTKEELEYLELRRKLKDHYRKQLRQETCTSAPLDTGTETKADGFGSFFGPSKPTIVPRVIEESTSLLQIEVLRVSNPMHGVEKAVNKTCAAGSKRSSNVPRPKVDPVKLKRQKMKDARDYSFLLSDDAKSQTPLGKKATAPKPEAPTKITEKGRRNSGSSRQRLKGRKPVSSKGKMQCSTPQDAKADSTAIKQNPTSSGHGNCNKAAELVRQAGLKNVMAKIVTDNLRKAVMAKVNATQEVNSANPPTSKPVNKPITKPVSSQKSLQDRPKKRPLSQHHLEEDDDGFDYRSEIRAMFKYNPDKYQDNDRDTRDMEAGFHDILKEERKSALIARKEDQIEQKRIEEEARQEKMKKDAKRRKLSKADAAK